MPVLFPGTAVLVPLVPPMPWWVPQTPHAALCGVLLVAYALWRALRQRQPRPPPSAAAYAAIAGAFRRFSGRTAIVSAAGDAWTYDRLAREAEEVFKAVSAISAGGHTLAVLSPNLPQLWALQVAAKRVGATFAPLPLASPRELQHLLRLLAPAVLVVCRRVAVEPELLRDVPVVCFFDAAGSLAADMRAACARAAEQGTLGPQGLPRAPPARLETVLCTSGTSALPKVVAYSYAGQQARHPHGPAGALCMLLRVLRLAARSPRTGAALVALGRVFGRASGAVVLPNSLAWSGGWFVSWFALRTGGPLVLTDGYDADGFFALLVRHRAAFVWAMPAVAIDLSARDPAQLAELSSLRTVVCAGGTVPAAALLALRARLPPAVRVFNVYAGTEFGAVALGCITAASTAATVHRLTPLVARWRIADAQDREVAPGGVGEFQFKPLLAPTEGYYRNPAANAQLRAADGYYRTGDLAREVEPGVVQLEGRGGSVVSDGLGRNISLHEVTQVLCDHPDVVDAGVAASPGAGGGHQLHAVVVARTGQRPRDLGAFLAARLADFKRPRDVVVVRAVPRNANGKIDTAAVLRGAQDGACAAPSHG